jgi:diguanylate cyclase (GGDEF)-like protein
MPKRAISAASRWQVRPESVLTLLALTLFLGLVVFASVTKELGPAVLLSALMTIVGLIVWLIVRLQRAEVERDRALAWSRESEWRASHHQHLLQIAQNGPDSAQHVQQLHDLQREIAALRAREAVLEDQAYHDELTKLPNRTLLRDRFSLAMERSKRSGAPFAVMMVDLNGFKEVNDKHGHEIGDFVLISTANRISGALRASDTVARVGGDEFVLVIESITDPEEFQHVSQNLLEVLFEPMNLPNGKTIGVGASLGRSIYPHDGADLSTLLSVADQAMYQCKATGLAKLY